MEILLELRILRLEKHGYLLSLLFLEVGLLLRTVRSGMAVFSTDGAFDDHSAFRLEGTRPRSMSLDLAVITEVVIYTLYLIIVAIKQIFEFLIFFSVKDFFDLIDSFFELIVIVSDDDDM
jgi:hypothetical protein